MATVTKTLEINKIQNLLKAVFIIVPIVAGLDKFFNILAQWDTYLAPATLEMLPFSGETFMKIVGIIEIVAGIIVAIRTQIGAYIVSLWLLLIALSLIFTWHHPDVAVRDIVMAISAFILAKLSTPASNAG
ncbi:tRNA (5-methylaminomethyl-2-thiouridylate)-methyltransferase [Aequorivita aquimaris]|uniref:tRNA (5-methylaminomethyl-2-thiouridylate)-methyltransferase n=1 Tax=Aequorivita aquimaris TaxID=1548749 RepID=A0A137RHF6_9FLAO|nr:hypothetical protein [Aequorivita aquimaris]KXN98926.1 tRNA (5-methylaminomethyl-2-thiouridylate)-methyltransferase [Aequorivita aquimaris]